MHIKPIMLRSPCYGSYNGPMSRWAMPIRISSFRP
ncbi:hypothetical protein LINPERPRIM_LOCUS7335 [Linum perenne]